MEEELSVSIFDALFEKYQFRTSTEEVPELYNSNHSPFGHAASSYPFGFGMTSLIQTEPPHG